MTRRVAIVRPLLLALVLAAGFGLVYAALTGWGVSMVDSVFRSGQLTVAVAVANHGEPYLYEYSSDYTSARELTLEGEEIREAGRRWSLAGHILSSPEDADPDQARQWRYRVSTLSDQESPAVYWYLVHDGRVAGHGHFVGFHSQSKGRVGYIGLHGFRNDEPPIDDRFPMRISEVTAAPHDASQLPAEPRNHAIQRRQYDRDQFSDRAFYFVSGSRVVGVHLGDDAIQTVFEAADILGIGFIMPAWPSPADKTQPPVLPKTRMAIRRSDRITLVSHRGDVLDEFRLPDELRGVTFHFYQLNRDAALAVIRTDETAAMHYDLVWFNPSGEVTRRHHVAAPKSVSPFDWPRLGGWLRASVMPSPAVSLFAVPGPEVWRHRGLGRGRAIRAALAATWPPLTCVFILAAVLALQTYRWNRRLGQPWSWAWAVFVFVFGLPGLVGYRLHRRWPAQAPCPACRATVPHDRLFCTACGENFPRPEPKDTQVISP